MILVTRRRAALVSSTTLVAGLLLGLFIPAAGSIALATDQASASSTFSTDTLDPASNLRCAGATSCTVAFVTKPALTWTATPDTYATGYHIYRSTTSGSGYVLIDSVAGRTNTAYTDTTVSALTTYYYVVRANAAAWTSVESNQVTAIVLL